MYTRPELEVEILTKVIGLLLVSVIAAAQKPNLDGYVFREADGAPPRRSLTMELLDGAKARYRVRTRPDGTFVFHGLREGRYKIRARFNEFVIVDDAVTVTGAGKNFAVVMLPKRRAGLQTFATVTPGRLAAESNGRLQRILREGSRLVARRDLSNAARLYERAVLEGPPQAEVEDALGVLYLYMGDRTKACLTFEKAIGHDGQYLPAYAHLAAAYLEQGKYEELGAVANRALTVDPRWLTGHVYLAEAGAGKGNLQAAQRSAETASEISRGRAPGPYLLLAKIYWAKRDCGNARRNLERYLELNTSARNVPELGKRMALMKACRAVP